MTLYGGAMAFLRLEDSIVNVSPELKSILKLIGGKVICTENGEKTEYASGGEAADHYGPFYRANRIYAENGVVVLEVKDYQAEINEENAKYIKEYKEKYGVEPNLFDGV